MAPVRTPWLKRPPTIIIKQDIDFLLRGDEARRPGEIVHVEVWDVHLIPTFLVEPQSPCAASPGAIKKAVLFIVYHSHFKTPQIAMSSVEWFFLLPAF